MDAYHQIVMEKGLWEFTTFMIPGKGKACLEGPFLWNEGGSGFLSENH